MPGPTTAPTKVAIACQGGGSQTAFTAGVLDRILRDPGLGRDFEIVALSGTSGGAVCSLLAWYGLRAHDGSSDRGARAADLVSEFWELNSAHEDWDRFLVNPLLVGIHRLVDAGWLPTGQVPFGQPQLVLRRMKELIEKLVPFAELPAILAGGGLPILLCGAVEVLSGEFAVFEETAPDPGWRRERIEDHPSEVAVETILASAAVPPLMPAVPVGDGLYWDGLFAHNPPIRSLVDRDLPMRPDEIWVVQIDPESRSRVPTSPVGIVDRRFELSSNLSLNAELHWIRQINAWVQDGVLPSKQFQIIDVARIPMTDELAGGLDLASKIDRDPAYLHRLSRGGRMQADAFLQQRSDPAASWWLPRFPGSHRPVGAR